MASQGRSKLPSSKVKHKKRFQFSCLQFNWGLKTKMFYILHAKNSIFVTFSIQTHLPPLSLRVVGEIKKQDNCLLMIRTQNKKA